MNGLLLTVAGVEKRRDHRNLPSSHAISVIPPLLNTITKEGGGGVFPLKKKNSTRQYHSYVL